jgi:hypothetical protein
LVRSFALRFLGGWGDVDLLQSRANCLVGQDGACRTFAYSQHL